MTWLSQLFAKTGMKNPLVPRQSRVPGGLWTKCIGCETNLMTDKLLQNMNVCEHCNYHHVWSVEDRIRNTMDTGFSYISISLPPDDPLNFVDTKSYKSRLQEARDKSMFNDAFAIVDGSINQNLVISVFMDFNFIGGSMGIAVGDAIVKASQVAIERSVPLIIFSASGGARMQEGLFSLMQMPRTIIAVEQVKAAGLPYIAVLLHPTTGGVLASFASRATITLAEPGAVIGFTGQRVIKDTLGIKLPKGFQSAEFVYEKGFIDQIVHRKSLRPKLISCLNICALN